MIKDDPYNRYYTTISHLQDACLGTRRILFAAEKLPLWMGFLEGFSSLPCFCLIPCKKHGRATDQRTSQQRYSMRYGVEHDAVESKSENNLRVHHIDRDKRFLRLQ